VRRADGSLITSGSLESTTPVLVWDPPTMGLPNRYQVQAYAVAAQSDGGVRTTQVVGRLFTERTEGHVPPGMLQPGTSYVFQIAADNCTASDPGRPVKLNWQTTCGLSQNVSLVFTTPSP
jgi:hypothetical protein